MNISQKNREKILSRWEKVHTKQQKRIIFDECSLAILSGFLAGDGSVQKRHLRKHVRYQLDLYADDVVMLGVFLHELQWRYGVTLTITSKENMLVARITSKILNEDLLRHSSYGLDSWSMPRLSFYATCLWLKAFYSAEGYVGKRVIRLQTINSKGMQQISDALMRLAISHKRYSYQNVSIICILRRSARLRFAKLIGFFHEKKSMALRKSLSL